jgi:hypothetical protein
MKRTARRFRRCPFTAHADFTQELPRKLPPTRAKERQRRLREKRLFPRRCLSFVGPGGDLGRAHNPKVAGSNPAPATTCRRTGPSSSGSRSKFECALCRRLLGRPASGSGPHVTGTGPLPPEGVHVTYPPGRVAKLLETGLGSRSPRRLRAARRRDDAAGVMRRARCPPAVGEDCKESMMPPKEHRKPSPR